MNRVIYACDIGSVRSGNFAWVRVVPGGGVPSASCSIDCLVEGLIKDAKSGKSIALGFECPLFMPVPKDSTALNEGRDGDGNRSMFAPAGATVTTLGIHEIAWIFRNILRDIKPLDYTLDWNRWPPQESRQIFLVWEAFVSGDVHGTSHKQDAATAAMFFLCNENNLGVGDNPKNEVTTKHPSMCLVHAAALWAGLAEDRERLHCSCLVLKPDKLEHVYTGELLSYACKERSV